MNIHFSKNIAAMLLCLLYALNGFCGDKPVDRKSTRLNSSH